MGRYDSINAERRHRRKEQNLLRGSKELSEMIDKSSREMEVMVVQNIPDIKKIDYVVLFKLREPLTPIEFQTLLKNKLGELI